MQEIINKLTEQIEETDEQRAQRLEETGAEAGVNPETLYEIEQEVRSQTRALATDHQERIDEQLQSLQTLAVLAGGLDRTVAKRLLRTDALVTLFSQGVSEKPRELAATVYRLDSLFEQRGLYAEIDVEAVDPAGALEDVVYEAK